MFVLHPQIRDTFPVVVPINLLMPENKFVGKERRKSKKVIKTFNEQNGCNTNRLIKIFKILKEKNN